MLVLEYWREHPPEAEMMSFFARAYTNWEPASRREMTEEQVEQEHRKSLEVRWKSGQAVSPAQMVAGGLGGKMLPDGIWRDAEGRPIPGTHKFPGM